MWYTDPVKMSSRGKILVELAKKKNDSKIPEKPCRLQGMFISLYILNPTSEFIKYDIYIFLKLFKFNCSGLTVIFTIERKRRLSPNIGWKNGIFWQGLPPPQFWTCSPKSICSKSPKFFWKLYIFCSKSSETSKRSISGVGSKIEEVGGHYGV